MTKQTVLLNKQANFHLLLSINITVLFVYREIL